MSDTPTIHDSGKRQDFDTGAVRDTADGKPRPNLISPIFEERLAGHLTAGAAKYDDRNWEKGIPLGRTMDSLLRHLRAYREGKREEEEDHLAAAACNIMFLIHTEEMIRRGLLPVALLDLQDYTVPEVPLTTTTTTTGCGVYGNAKPTADKYTYTTEQVGEARVTEWEGKHHVSDSWTDSDVRLDSEHSGWCFFCGKKVPDPQVTLMAGGGLAHVRCYEKHGIV